MEKIEAAVSRGLTLGSNRRIYVIVLAPNGSKSGQVESPLPSLLDQRWLGLAWESSCSPSLEVTFWVRF